MNFDQMLDDLAAVDGVRVERSGRASWFAFTPFTHADAVRTVAVRHRAVLHDVTRHSASISERPGGRWIMLESRIPHEHITTAVAVALLELDRALPDGVDLDDTGQVQVTARNLAALDAALTEATRDPGSHPHPQMLAHLHTLNHARRILQDAPYATPLTPTDTVVEVLATLLSDTHGGARPMRGPTDPLVRVTHTGLTNPHLTAVARALAA